MCGACAIVLFWGLQRWVQLNCTRLPWPPLPLDRLHTYIHPYILFTVSERAKLFKNGGSQAVRLPADCRFPDGQREVSVKRIGRKVVLEPIDEWPKAFCESLGTWHETIERPEQDSVSAQHDPFEE